MKKVFTLFASLLLVGSLMAQTIVSTEVQKRNVLIEEFTGVNCGYCPDGHARANAICDYFYGHAWAINIHAGGYANGSGYTTPVGDGIHNLFYSQIEGYPCGVVNRGSVQDRGQWANSAVSIRNEDSPVNLAAMGELDVDARTLTVHLEAYNTSNTDLSAYMLNIAVVQNNIIGQQSNYGNYNTDYITDDGQYRHMHMLRDMLTGQWGVEIPSTQGAFFDTTFVYAIPETINGVAVNDVRDIDLIAFLTAPTHKNVITAAKVIVPEEKAKLHKLTAVQAADCSLEYNFELQIENNTVKDITSVTLNIDGNETTLQVDIPQLSLGIIELPSYTFTVSGEAVQECNGTKTVSLVSYTTSDNGTVNVNSEAKTANYGGFKIYTAAGPFVVRAGVDAYASEASIQLVDQSNCSVLWSSSAPYSDISTQNVQYISQLPDARFVKVTFNPEHPGLYILRAADQYGDGWAYTNNDNPSGVWLSNSTGEIFAESWGYSNGPAFSYYDFYLNVTSTGDGSHVGIEDVDNVSFSIYPNPATDRLTIESSEAVREINIIDMTGRTVMTLGAENSVNVSSLAAGVYVVRVATANGVGMQKFVKE